MQVTEGPRVRWHVSGPVRGVCEDSLWTRIPAGWSGGVERVEGGEGPGAVSLGSQHPVSPRGHSPQLRNCATLRSRRSGALLSSWCSPSSRSRRPSSPGLPPASPRTSRSSARSRRSMAAAGAPRPGYSRASGMPARQSVCCSAGRPRVLPPPSRPPRCHLPPRQTARPHLRAATRPPPRPRRTDR